MSGKPSGSLSLSRLLPLIGAFLAFSMVAGLLAAGVALPFVGSAGLAAKSASDHFEDLPGDFETPNLPQRTKILDANGGLIASLWGYEGNRVMVKMNQISSYMPHALVSIEDSNFYKEGPLSIRGTLRAAVTDANAGGAAQGGSTLTQQYVKNVLVQEAGDNQKKIAEANGDTLNRKIQELKYAVAVYQKFTKSEILERYLNLVYFGENAYGVQVAAETYFSEPASKLTIPQAATLAAVVNSPTAYDPLVHPQDALTRRNIVIKKMAAAHYITAQQAATATASPIGTRPQRQNEGCISVHGSAAFFCQYVEDDILNNTLYGKTKTDRENFLDSGLTIKTTMVPQAENSVDKSISEHLSKTDQVDAAMAMVKPGTGQVEAMGQSEPMGSGSGETYINYSADAKHGGATGRFGGFQAGSTFKAFIGMAAIEQGYGPSTVIPSPYQLTSVPPISTCSGTASDPTWQPTNQTHSEGTPGETMTTAYWLSVNTYFIQLEEKTGLCRPAQIAAAFGLTKDSDDGTGAPLDQVPSFTLGTNPITPLAMANAYATIASNGIYCKPIEIQSVTSVAGTHYPVPQAGCKRVISPSTTQTLTTMLQGVISNPNGTAHAIYDPNRPEAGKTGTNDQLSMTWFDGYTPNLAGAVWVGDPNHPDADESDVVLHGSLYPGGNSIGKLYGASVSAPIFGDAMEGALVGVPVEGFALPPAGSGTPPKPKTPNPPPGGQNGGQQGGVIGGLFNGGQSNGGPGGGGPGGKKRGG